ncbi:MAG: DNA polymerase III subunit beta, partial [Pseudonocardiaceae bacterium]
MRFRAERDALVDAMATAARAAATRGGALPALSGIRMALTDGRLHLAGSDLDLTVQVELGVAGDESGVCVVPARLATDIVRALEPGGVTLAVEGGEAIISSGRSQFAVRLLPAEEFLRLPEVSGDAVGLEASSLVSALHQVVPAASKDDSRPILTGVLFEAESAGLRLVSTDSYRLALRDLPGTTLLAEGQSVLVPSRALGELARLLGGAERVDLWLGSDEASFSVVSAKETTVRLTTRLLEGDFPNYRQLIPPHYPNRLSIAKEPLLDAVRRVKLLARDAAPVRMALSADSVELSAIT